MKGEWRRKRQARRACSSIGGCGALAQAPGTNTKHPAPAAAPSPPAGQKRRKEGADPQKSPYRVLASSAGPQSLLTVAEAARQCPSLMDLSRTSAAAPELCFWKASQLSLGTEGLQALPEHQPVPQADGILRREAQTGAHRHHQLLGSSIPHSLAAETALEGDTPALQQLCTKGNPGSSQDRNWKPCACHPWAHWRSRPAESQSPSHQSWPSQLSTNAADLPPITCALGALVFHQLHSECLELSVCAHSPELCRPLQQLPTQSCRLQLWKAL